MPYVRLGVVPRAIALIALLSVGIVAPLAPTAAADPETALLCFEGQDEDGVVVPNGTCRAGAQDPANYLQGDTVRIRVVDVQTQEPLTPNHYVKVWCVANCREVDGYNYYAVWNHQSLRFPYDFHDSGPRDDGRSATGDKVPRYNSTWKAAVLLPDGRTSERTFNVWTMDVFRSANLTVQPGEHHRIRSWGMEPRTNVEIKIERRVMTGVYETVVEQHTTVPIDGVFRYEWKVPKDETRRIADCGTRTEDCYRLIIRGGGKGNETLPFRVGPATLEVTNVVATPPGNGITAGDAFVRERTQSVEMVFSINYPGGTFRTGPKLEPGDIRESITNPNRGLRVIIEKYNRTSPDRDPIFYNETRIHYVPERFAWVVNWTVPRDIPLDPTLPEPNSHYRLRLADARDAYDNRIPGRVLGNFSIFPATLTPVLVQPPSQVARTEEGAFRFAVRYHNGSILGPAENATGLQGCIVRDTSPLRPTCPESNTTWLKHENDTWVLRARFPRDYEHVNGDGAHRVFLKDGFQDPWGNKVDAREDDLFRAFVGGRFTVVPASPRVEFTTVQRGEESTVLVRGNRIGITATIQYADGSAFNHTVLDNQSRTLNMTVTRRGANDAVQHQGTLVLRETNPRHGQWYGELELTRDDTTTPTGRWTFAFDLRDNLTVPNVNFTAFDRDVAAALIKLIPTNQPSSSAPTGATMKFRFRLFFEDGRVVPTSTIGDKLTARVFAYDKAQGKPVGDPVSGLLVPAAIPHNDGEFQIDWTIPNRLFAGEYVFVVRGGDAFGNKLGDDAQSRSWSTFTETRERSVLVQPQKAVKRGESATVVFDGQQGDVGGPAIGVPAIRLERWDAGTARWVVERATTRVSDPTTTDHIGVFPVTTNTVIGVYRFRLEGRDATFNQIHSVSDNFTVDPTVVQRTITETPPERVVKGDMVEFTIERRDGDRILSAEVLYNGRPTELQRPLMTAQGPVINITFQVPYEAPTGNYSVRVLGRDLYGNTLEVLSPLVDVAPAELLGKIIGNPARVVERGEAATVMFGITNPDGGFYFAPDEPEVEVHNGTGIVAKAQVTREGLTFRASWTPDHRAEETEYYFVISGTSAGGNTFPTLRSQTFRIAPGLLTRSPASDIGLENVRMSTITFAVPFEADDEYAAFKLGYYGPSYDVAPALFETRDPTTMTALPHTIDVQSGRYIARFVTDHTTSLGAYRIFMEAKDRYGNEVASKSDVFLLKPTTILVTWDAAPPDSSFGEQKTYERSFVARYRDGTIMREAHGTPQVALLYDDGVRGRLPVQQRPEVTYRQERWFVTWTGPAVMPDGAYTFSVGGTDVAGNTIASSTTNDILLYRKIEDSAGIFLKEVPAPSPLLLLALVGAVAALGARRRDPARR